MVERERKEEEEEEHVLSMMYVCVGERDSIILVCVYVYAHFDF